jgi:hypothetical protein
MRGGGIDAWSGWSDDTARDRKQGSRDHQRGTSELLLRARCRIVFRRVVEHEDHVGAEAAVDMRREFA